MTASGEPLEYQIRKRIQREGPISLETYLELVLYHPVHGYYEQKERALGRGGDFYTSVQAGGLFGKLLAHRFSQWLRQGESNGARLVEAGAHHGQLALDILAALRDHYPQTFERVEYWFLEPSPVRRIEQEKMLQAFLGKVHWRTDWNEIPERSIRGVLFSNELLDAFPFRLFAWNKKKGWEELGVTLGREGLDWAALPNDGKAAFPWSLPDSLLEVLPEGFQVEWNPRAAEWWERAASRLDAGKLVTFDYGLPREQFFAPHRSRGTWRCYSKHRQTTALLDRPGEADVTAHVNFTDLIEAGERTGLTTEHFMSQHRFLSSIATEIIRTPWFSSDPSTMRQFQTLTHPDQLGASFQVLVQGR